MATGKVSGMSRDRDACQGMKKVRLESVVGRWRIVWMSEWDQEYVDMEVPGNIIFAPAGQGSFQFGMVVGQIDWRLRGHRVDFTWTGSCEADAMNGRGHAEIVDGELRGHLYIHLGDDSTFHALRQVGTLASTRRRNPGARR